MGLFHAVRHLVVVTPLETFLQLRFEQREKREGQYTLGLVTNPEVQEWYMISPLGPHLVMCICYLIHNILYYEGSIQQMGVIYGS